MREANLNTFETDPNSEYIFSIKQLGWANIDRVYSNPRTKNVELITAIDNYTDFENIYITLLMDKEKIFIPGYQKKDLTYGFTHGDYEKEKLPVGESAIIIATAYKNDIPYYSIQKITISEKQKVSFSLIETTMEKLKLDLEDKI
jgi:hypothetical protein